MEVINLNFIPSGANPVAHASQFDEGRTTRFNLFDGSAVYTLDGTEIITVSVRKPDGHIVTEAVTNTSDSYVEVVTTEQMTACAGDNLAQIKVEKGGDTIGFLNYILQVQKDPEDGGDPSASFIHDLNQQIADAVADQYDAADVVFDAVPTAGHGVGFAVTSEGVKNAIPDELDDLSDVTYTGTPSSGEAVVWDGSKWTNGTPDMDISDLADVTITTPSDDDILVYQNGEWVNIANPASTANFGPDYDENTTYNTGDKCVYNNLLYECNDDGVTGAWDATKWDSLTVASMTDNNLPHFSGTPTAGTTAEAINGKVANLAFDSSTMFADISTAVKNAFNLSECYCYVLKNGNVCTVTLRFKCANAVASGSFDITGLTPCKTDVTSALASLDNKGGYMQLSGTVLYIRCSASASQYLAGSITYPTYKN